MYVSYKNTVIQDTIININIVIKEYVQLYFV